MTLVRDRVRNRNYQVVLADPAGGDDWIINGPAFYTIWNDIIYFVAIDEYTPRTHRRHLLDWLNAQEIVPRYRYISVTHSMRYAMMGSTMNAYQIFTRRRMGQQAILRQNPRGRTM